MFAPVDIVAKEEVVFLVGLSEEFEDVEQVVVLSVGISADLDGGIQFEEHGLF